MPYLSSSTQLDYLNLADNQLTNYSVENANLRILVLARNNLNTFPNLTLASNLHLLDISFNNITNLHDVEFHDLWLTLQTLVLNNNNIVELPVGIFDNFYFLRFLYLDINSLTTINKTIFEDMKLMRHLTMDYNHLKSLPLHLFTFNGRLISLSLKFNNLTVLFSETFYPLARLESLYIEGNYII